MSLFFSYLKQQLKYILLFLLFSITFAITFFFYNFPLEALTYPTLLCVCFGLFFFIWDFSKTKALHTMLMELSNLTELSVDMIRAIHSQTRLKTQIISSCYLVLPSKYWS